ncbi:hypothetical protein [Helicobacter salomonis]|uniref:hypothetical protein n=1 Tax=Helicobacter salomonis TaxID=56878 RepID=UPI000CF0E40B|nr:hypothetical protein [Helicobacter salomonis]
MAQLYDGACNGWNWTNNTGKGVDLLITLRGCSGEDVRHFYRETRAEVLNAYGPGKQGASVRIWLNTLRFDMIVPG